MNDPIPFAYPAIYDAASDLSSISQRRYLSLLAVEYSLLLVAAVMALDFSDDKLYYVLYGLVFIASLFVLLYRSSSKPEQEWYKGRALAESIKTSVWRYCMRAAPFADAESVAIPRGEFRNHLLSVLETNRHIGERVPSDTAASDQITLGMDTTRKLTLEDRKNYYDTLRVREQRRWYQEKAARNKQRGSQWVRACVAVYGIAIASVLLRIVYPEWKLWPTEPLIVAASSMLGWIQIKRFNELASAYALTAHEIGIIQGRISEITSESELSVFVNEAELAFSREHTQWVARQ